MVEEFEIKLATIEDMKDVFDLSNDDLVRANSFNQEKIEWKNHQKWFEQKLNDKNCIFYIFRGFQNTFLGYVRLDNDNEKWIITIHINPDFRCKGYGTNVLKNVVELNKDKKMIAFVKENNLASYNSFLKAGFKLIELIKKDNEKIYKLENQ